LSAENLIDIYYRKFDYYVENFFSEYLKTIKTSINCEHCQTDFIVNDECVKFHVNDNIKLVLDEYLYHLDQFYILDLKFHELINLKKFRFSNDNFLRVHSKFKLVFLKINKIYTKFLLLNFKTYISPIQINDHIFINQNLKLFVS